MRTHIRTHIRTYVRTHVRTHISTEYMYCNVLSGFLRSHDLYAGKALALIYIYTYTYIYIYIYIHIYIYNARNAQDSDLGADPFAKFKQADFTTLIDQMKADKEEQIKAQIAAEQLAALPW